ncbi:unnamed protein product [Amoebophrya sp. A25]|nr:unnamed protein product [Amoebophrya sp. A25]|eukprot:GSA25T00023329001.1
MCKIILMQPQSQPVDVLRALVMVHWQMQVNLQGLDAKHADALCLFQFLRGVFTLLPRIVTLVEASVKALSESGESGHELTEDTSTMQKEHDDARVVYSPALAPSSVAASSTTPGSGGEKKDSFLVEITSGFTKHQVDKALPELGLRVLCGVVCCVLGYVYHPSRIGYVRHPRLHLGGRRYRQGVLGDAFISACNGIVSASRVKNLDGLLSSDVLFRPRLFGTEQEDGGLLSRPFSLLVATFRRVIIYCTAWDWAEAYEDLSRYVRPRSQSKKFEKSFWRKDSSNGRPLDELLPGHYQRFFLMDHVDSLTTPFEYDTGKGLLYRDILPGVDAKGLHHDVLAAILKILGGASWTRTEEESRQVLSFFVEVLHAYNFEPVTFESSWLPRNMSRRDVGAGLAVSSVTCALLGEIMRALGPHCLLDERGQGLLEKEEEGQQDEEEMIANEEDKITLNEEPLLHKPTSVDRATQDEGKVDENAAKFLRSKLCREEASIRALLHIIHDCETVSNSATTSGRDQKALACARTCQQRASVILRHVLCFGGEEKGEGGGGSDRALAWKCLVKVCVRDGAFFCINSVRRAFRKFFWSRYCIPYVTGLIGILVVFVILAFFLPLGFTFVFFGELFGFGSEEGTVSLSRATTFIRDIPIAWRRCTGDLWHSYKETYPYDINCWRGFYRARTPILGYEAVVSIEGEDWPGSGRFVAGTFFRLWRTWKSSQKFEKNSDTPPCPPLVYIISNSISISSFATPTALLALLLGPLCLYVTQFSFFENIVVLLVWSCFKQCSHRFF